MTLDFRGLSAFPITPAHPDGRVAVDAFSRLVDRLASAGVDSIGILGSTGGYAYLSRTERQRAIAAAVEAAQGRAPLLAGIGALRTDDACALARDAASEGAAGLLLAPVSYTPLTQDEVFAHFAEVAGATALPLCVYNNPATTHFEFSHALLSRIAALPSVVSVKMPLPADADLAPDIATLRKTLPEGFGLGYSGDWGCAEALLAGADTWFSVVGGLMPEAALALARAAQGGAHADTRRIDAAFGPLWALFRTHGSLRVIHAMAQLEGVQPALPPRPILPLDGDVLAQIEAARDEIDAAL